jgi:hypothetical protein
MFAAIAALLKRAEIRFRIDHAGNNYLLEGRGIV